MVDGGGGSLRAENGQWHESKKSRFRQTLVDGGSLGTDNGPWWRPKYRLTMADGGSLGIVK